MGVERLEHALDGRFGQFVLVDGIDVEFGDGQLRHLQFAEHVDVRLFLLLVLTQQLCLCGGGDEAEEGGEQDGEERSVHGFSFYR